MNKKVNMNEKVDSETLKDEDIKSNSKVNYMKDHRTFKQLQQDTTKNSRFAIQYFELWLESHSEPIEVQNYEWLGDEATHLDELNDRTPEDVKNAVKQGADIFLTYKFEGEEYTKYIEIKVGKYMPDKMGIKKSQANSFLKQYGENKTFYLFFDRRSNEYAIFALDNSAKDRDVENFWVLGNKPGYVIKRNELVWNKLGEVK